MKENMQIIPAINCGTFGCVLKKLALIHDIPTDWVHLDIADGRFANPATWGNPDELASITEEWPELHVEAHFMVERPERILDDWFRAGVKRAIIHVEVLHNKMPAILKLKHYGKIGVALKPDTPLSVFLPYLQYFHFVQILGVHPGPSGQVFQESVLEKVRELRKNHPKIMIEVDGGVTPETLVLIKKAGAHIAVSSSYIFNAAHPKKAYEKLKSI